MIYFNKIFKIPGPKDLGMADSNHAMPSKFFNNRDGAPDWDDYYSFVQKKYPIKYFLAATLPGFILKVFNKFWRPLTDFIYWIKCHTIKSHQYHLIDLRSYNDKYPYTHGWMDVDHRMERAIIILFNEFMTKEFDKCYLPSEEEVKKEPGLQVQRDAMLEMQDLHNWIINTRPWEEHRINDISSYWHDLRVKKQYDLADATFKDIMQKEEELDKKLNQVLIRIIELRKGMWT